MRAHTHTRTRSLARCDGIMQLGNYVILSARVSCSRGDRAVVPRAWKRAPNIGDVAVVIVNLGLRPAQIGGGGRRTRKLALQENTRPTKATSRRWQFQLREHFAELRFAISFVTATQTHARARAHATDSCVSCGKRCSTAAAVVRNTYFRACCAVTSARRAAADLSAVRSAARQSEQLFATRELVWERN